MNIIRVVLSLAGLFILYHIIFITMVTFKVKKKKNYVSVTYEPCEFEMVPGLNEELFQSISEKLLKNGFEFVGDNKIVMGTSNGFIFSRRFIHKEKATIAGIHCAMINVQRQVLDSKVTIDSKKHTFEIYTKLSDGVKLISTESNKPIVFENDNSIRLTCKDIDEIDMLIKQHFEKLDELTGAKTLDYSVLAKSPEGLALESMKETYDNQVKRGVFSYNKDEDCYTYTWSAAVKTVLKMYLHRRFKRKKQQGNPFEISSKRSY